MDVTWRYSCRLLVPAQVAEHLISVPVTLSPTLHKANTTFPFQEWTRELARCPHNIHNREACNVMLFTSLAGITVTGGLWLRSQRWQWRTRRAGANMSRYDVSDALPGIWNWYKPADQSMFILILSLQGLRPVHRWFFLHSFFLKYWIKTSFSYHSWVASHPTITSKGSQPTRPALSKRDTV